MIELIRDFLNEWRTREEILMELSNMGIHTDGRYFRKAAARFNEQFERGETELFLAHSGRGYKITTDPSEIAKSLLDDRKRAIKLMKRYYRGMKELADKNQLTLLPDDEKLYDIVSKLGEA